MFIILYTIAYSGEIVNRRTSATSAVDAARIVGELIRDAAITVNVTRL